MLVLLYITSISTSAVRMFFGELLDMGCIYISCMLTNSITGVDSVSVKVGDYIAVFS